MPQYAALRRSLERKSLIFLGLGFFFEPEGGASEFGKRGLRFFVAHRVGIDSKSQRGVGMPELIGHPADGLPSAKHQRGPRMASAVQRERTEGLCAGLEGRIDL